MIGHVELPKELKELCQKYQLEEDLEGESPTDVFQLIGQSRTLRFFKRLQIEEDGQKIKYHLLLDTLF
jgi:aminoglycoside phosphotransferase